MGLFNFQLPTSNSPLSIPEKTRVGVSTGDTGITGRESEKNFTQRSLSKQRLTDRLHFLTPCPP
jgi:hypothetical protein